MENGAVLRMSEVEKAVGLSATTITRLERKGEFPPRRRLSAGAVGWVKAEVDTWIRERKAAAKVGAQVREVGVSKMPFACRLYPVSCCPGIEYDLDEEELFDSGFKVLAVVFEGLPEPELAFYPAAQDMPSEDALFQLYLRTMHRQAEKFRPAPEAV